MFLSTLALTTAYAVATTTVREEPPMPAAGVLRVSVDRPTHKISPTLYGIFFEEINNAGDGGLYAELVRNGSFEDDSKPNAWYSEGPNPLKFVDRASPSTYNRRCLELQPDGDPAITRNHGYRGMSVVKGASYRLSIQTRSVEGDAHLRAEIVGIGGDVLARKDIARPTSFWTTFETVLKASGTEPSASLRIVATGRGTVQIDNVSLMPVQTWKGRPNGLRRDLAKMLDGMKPSFVRFPGGCWVEGETMATAMRWKRTIGSVADRRTQPNLWGYDSTNGLGFHEYLQMCEDLGAKPLFVINCGMSHREVVPLRGMDEFVQDALDAVEYANGPVDSRWGSLRAKAGHPKPFGLEYMEIGNENGGPAYYERYPLFLHAIKSRYPYVHLIADVWGGIPKDSPVEIIDEHYYSTPQFFLDSADRYDAYNRKGPKVYVGEYAVTQGCGQGNLIAAIGEAAFMTGMERNSDVVVMASYAPLFAHVDLKRWSPDLICFDSSRSYGIPSYYVQQMFSRNRGDRVLPTEIGEIQTEKPRFPSGGVGVGTWATQAEFKDIKVTHGDGVLLDSADGSALKAARGSWSIENGAIKQASDFEGALAFAGDPSWSDYTLTLKARKLGGAEGFLITFGTRDEANTMWWNIGGWGNSRHAVEQSSAGGKSELGRSARGGVEIGRWYDIKVEYTRDRIRCFLDGKLIHTIRPSASRAVYATSSRDDKTGEDILKVVNASDKPRDLSVQLDGASQGRVAGSETVLTGKPMDENDLAQPKRVAPTTRKVSFAGPTFRHTFPAYSVTIMRVKTGL